MSAGTTARSLARAGADSVFASIEEIIDDARKGRLFVLVDDEHRENEGDLVVPAQWATPDAINFMARHGRGLICLALTEERARALHLEPMQRRNTNRFGTAFTVSIEAREGVATGISAADRATTIRAAIDPERGADDIATPGHVFPIVARGGGVLMRRRPYRGGRRHRPARRPHARRRDLRNHERRRHHGAAVAAARLLPRPRPQDRHDRRPHRLPPPQGPA